MIDQKIDKGPDARGKMFMPGKNRMDQLFFIRVPVRQDFNQCSGLEITLDMEPAKPRHAQPRKAKAAHGRAAVTLEISGDRPANPFTGIGVDERPFTHRDRKVKSQAVMINEVVRVAGQAALGNIFR